MHAPFPANKPQLWNEPVRQLAIFIPTPSRRLKKRYPASAKEMGHPTLFVSHSKGEKARASHRETSEEVERRGGVISNLFFTVSDDLADAQRLS
jgi:hypothetical protein